MKKETKDLWLHRLEWFIDNVFPVFAQFFLDVFSIAIGVSIAGVFLLFLYFRILSALGGT